MRLLALHRADAAIGNTDVPARHWLHSPAGSLVAISTEEAPLILLFQQLDNSLSEGEVGLAGLRRI